MRIKLARLTKEDSEDLFVFFRHIDVEVMSLQWIERDLIYVWMPQSNEPVIKLFRLLRDRVGGEARRRNVFVVDVLRRDLIETERVQFSETLPTEVLRAAVRDCANLLRHHKHTFGNTGVHITRQVVSEIVDWATTSGPEKQVAMLLDRAGMGKTVVMHDVLSALDTADVTTIGIKADLQLSGVTTISGLAEKLVLPAPIDRIVQQLAECGRVVVLIDQVDALSLSLARDQSALAVVLDLVARLRTTKGVRILMTCRTFDRKTDPMLKSIESEQEFVIPELSDSEVQETLYALQMDADALLPATRALLRVPLHLDLFARFIGNNSPINGSAITSLQDLFDHLWSEVVMKDEPGGPSIGTRIAALQLMTERMDHDRRTAVPQALFESPEASHLLPAVRWLRSAGVLISDGQHLAFLHQTFFDYCYARRFVERGNQLAAVILTGSQGLFERSKLLQVINYLRGTDKHSYLRELNALLLSPDLRFHLYDLLLQWFGQLTDPSDQESHVFRQLLEDAGRRAFILRYIEGNSGWFRKIKDNVIRSLLAARGRDGSGW